MLVATALFMAAVHDFENVVTADSDVSCNIVQLRYAVFFMGGRRPLSRSHDMYTYEYVFFRGTLNIRCMHNAYL